MKFRRNLRILNRFGRKSLCFIRNFGAYHALTGHKTGNISKTKADIEKLPTARYSTNESQAVCEIWHKSERSGQLY